MRKTVFAAFAIITTLLFVSCATEADPLGLKGVWEAEDDYEKYIFTFTSDGHYAYECYYDDILGYVSFGTYEADENYIYTDEMDYAYSWDGSNLIIDSNELAFVRKSKTARNNTSPSKLRGVWQNSYDGTVGFSSGGTFVTMSHNMTLDDYSAEDSVLKIGEDEYPYLIINSKLYILDDYDLFGGSTGLVFNRKTSEGKDQTLKEYLLQIDPWKLVDTGEGDDHYDYSFYSNGKYKLKYYNDYSSSEWTSEGTYTFSGHEISLSEDGDLAFAIIDLTPFMFSI